MDNLSESWQKVLHEMHEMKHNNEITSEAYDKLARPMLTLLHAISIVRKANKNVIISKEGFIYG